MCARQHTFHSRGSLLPTREDTDGVPWIPLWNPRLPISVLELTKLRSDWGGVVTGRRPPFTTDVTFASIASIAAAASPVLMRFARSTSPTSSHHFTVSSPVSSHAEFQWSLCSAARICAGPSAAPLANEEPKSHGTPKTPRRCWP